MAKPKHPPGLPMTLGNMRKLGVKRLIASCLNDTCRHAALIEVWSYPAETEISYFKRRVVCAKCGARGNKIDVRPNWEEQPPGESLTGPAISSYKLGRGSLFADEVIEPQASPGPADDNRGNMRTLGRSEPRYREEKSWNGLAGEHR